MKQYYRQSEKRNMLGDISLCLQYLKHKKEEFWKCTNEIEEGILNNICKLCVEFETLRNNLQTIFSEIDEECWLECKKEFNRLVTCYENLDLIKY